uniref:Uncharacterized protein n=1 Tax=Glossina brevipalpis TaxID=37001 RepID=A0A1A9WF17_9MUSC
MMNESPTTKLHNSAQVVVLLVTMTSFLVFQTLWTLFVATTTHGPICLEIEAASEQSAASNLSWSFGIKALDDRLLPLKGMITCREEWINQKKNTLLRDIVHNSIWRVSWLRRFESIYFHERYEKPNAGIYLKLKAIICQNHI